MVKKKKGGVSSTDHLKGAKIQVTHGSVQTLRLSGELVLYGLEVAHCSTLPEDGGCRKCVT